MIKNYSDIILIKIKTMKPDKYEQDPLNKRCKQKIDLN